MSDDYHRPTLTFPNGAYNATQVRLYGIEADIGISFPGQASEISDTNIYVQTADDVDADERDINAAKELLNKATSNKARRGIILGRDKYSPIPIRASFSIKLDMKELGIAVVTASTHTYILGSKPEKELSCGLMVGYAYEGHTYDLPKPKIMLVNKLPEWEIPKDDSDYKLKEDEGYAVWIVDKLDQCVEIEMNQGFVEQLVLEANLPGKRSPTMYAARQALGHRSGRLTE
ncbi:hypothetical protein RFM26_04950 [Mesorhizobium sp. VK23B]|uniref:Uncharacterized protein n=1 Tax=Mesorhizobium dulcispinae TaxID=3072316 RepID=A0ABU4XD90_9HYPH|nr:MULTISPECIES: hypothetical protein [unclassified Mesorhizobium]MDX8465029.1 hypothetical protein [Mesorhizobium sp. VK23B]MDX8472754.1 hypothetical protein [Mesorhizobium sp. VK23A]MDX8518336.1 hypothetical protein [Mesorhizobium sp. VK23D]